MDERQLGDFLAAWGEEFCQSLGPAVGWENITPQDGYEVFVRVFKQDPSPGLLASLSELQLEQLREGCERYFECPGIAVRHLRNAVTRTLTRWPPDRS